MKLFPALFYIACIVLLGIRLRPLHHSTSGPVTNVLWWQRELDLWVGWIYRLITALITWLRKPTQSSLPLTIPDPGHSHLPFWRIDGHIKSIVSQCLRSLHMPLNVAMGSVQTSLAVQVGDYMKELMVSPRVPLNH